MRLPAFFKISARSIAMACSILLVLLIAACGSSTTTSGSTPTATSQPASSPTVASTPTTSTSLATYTGSSYIIGYPQGWKVNASGNQVYFTDASNVYKFAIIVTPDPGGTVSPDTLLTAGLQGLTSSLKNTQPVNMPASTTIGGDTWVQKAVAGTPSSGSTTGMVEAVAASDNHPANSASTNNFTIAYGTQQSNFDTANTQYFQPMLQSFKFTS